MKNILCFGDSNTWGYEPVTKNRFNQKTRWTGVLQQTLGNKFRVIEEGLNGRTTIHNEKDRLIRSGAEILPVLIESHAPLDLIIIMLGTNDLKAKFNSTPSQISANIKTVCNLAKSNEYNPSTQVLLISPSHVVEMKQEDSYEFDGAMDKSKELAKYYKNVANELSINFFDASLVVKTTTKDGIHWTANQHSDFALQLAIIIKNLLK
jgi:lysophospholipase L1-like esterase